MAENLIYRPFGLSNGREKGSLNVDCDKGKWSKVHHPEGVTPNRWIVSYME